MALHLLLVWATTTAAVLALGSGMFLAVFGGDARWAVGTIALGLPPAVGLLSLAGLPVRSVVPLCDSAAWRLGWAVLVFALGTIGGVAALAAHGGDVVAGSALFLLTGVPYAVTAAFFVPVRWVRVAALAVPAAGVVYVAALGPG